MIELPQAEESYDDMLSHFDTVPERDRQTDGRTELLHQYRASALRC